jgi:hypothetical protein
MLDPKAMVLFGISSLTAVFGFLNILKKPKDSYLRLAVILNITYLFMIYVSLPLKGRFRFLG